MVYLYLSHGGVGSSSRLLLHSAEATRYAQVQILGQPEHTRYDCVHPDPVWQEDCGMMGPCQWYLCLSVYLSLSHFFSLMEEILK